MSLTQQKTCEVGLLDSDHDLNLHTYSVMNCNPKIMAILRISLQLNKKVSFSYSSPEKKIKIVVIGYSTTQK